MAENTREQQATFTRLSWVFHTLSDSHFAKRKSWYELVQQLKATHHPNRLQFTIWAGGRYHTMSTELLFAEIKAENMDDIWFYQDSVCRNLYSGCKL